MLSWNMPGKWESRRPLGSTRKRESFEIGTQPFEIRIHFGDQIKKKPAIAQQNQSKL